MAFDGDRRSWQCAGLQQRIAARNGAAHTPCMFFMPTELCPLRARTHIAISPSKPPACSRPATMASREELEAEALKLFTGIGLAEKTAQ